MFDVRQMIQSLIANNANPQAGRGLQIGPAQPVQTQSQSQSQGMTIRGGGGQSSPVPSAFTAPPPEGLPPQMAQELAAAKQAYADAHARANGPGVFSSTIAKHRDLPGAQEAYQQKEMEAATLLEKQRQQEAESLADDVFSIANRMGIPPEQGRQMAERAMRDPTYGREVQKAFLERQGVLDERKFAQSEEVNREYETASQLIEYGIPEEHAKQLALDPGLSVKDAVDLWYNQIDRGNESLERDFQVAVASGKFKDKMDNAIRQAERSLEAVSPWSAGFASLTSIVPGTPAASLKTMLDSQRATIAFNELKAMREASKTGGALGNVSNREIELLYNSFAALSETTDPQVLRTSLNDILMAYEGMKYGMSKEREMWNAVKAGEITVEEAERQMEQGKSKVVNESMMKRTAASSGYGIDVQQQALEMVLSGEDTLKNFEETFGWRPRIR